MTSNREQTPPRHSQDNVHDVSGTAEDIVQDASSIEEDLAQTNTGQQTSNKATVYQAAEVLGITVDAIRKRIQRGTIPYERHDDGRVYVLLDEASKSQGGSSGASGISAGSVQAASGQQVGVIQDTGRDELIENLKDQIEHLRRIIDTRDMELQRKDSIIAALTQRIPELEAPAEPRETPGVATQDAIGSTTTGTPDPQEPAQRRSWLYRFFFGP